MAETIFIGVDEAGRGPLFGRVYASACVLPSLDDPTFDFTLIKDSKKFTSEKKIKNVYDYIREHSIAYAYEYSDEKLIDEINILQATQRAMHGSVKKVIQYLIDTLDNFDINNVKLLIDGNYFNEITYFWNGELHVLNHQCVVGGDDLHKCIGAASIIAKVERDEYIKEICNENDDLNDKYGLLKNKGYGTKQHIEGIRTHGYSKFHRASFKIKKI